MDRLSGYFAVKSVNQNIAKLHLSLQLKASKTKTITITLNRNLSVQPQATWLDQEQTTDQRDLSLQDLILEWNADVISP